LAAISVIGLGKLGSPFAAVAAAHGHTVVGVDQNRRFVDAINERRAPVPETDLDETLAQVGDRLRATNDTADAISSTDVTFVIVPTPSRPDGAFALDYALAAMEQIGEALAGKDGFHVVVLTSTVMPGATDGPIRAAIERASGKRAGVDFGLCYSPEFIALGSVVRDFLNPAFLLIGESDPRSGDLLGELYRTWCANDPPIARMSAVNAEVAKLAVNTFVTTKISYANMLAQVCERLPGANVDVVTSAVGLDTRIGTKYLKGGARYGGPCFPRDNRAFAALAGQVGAEAALARATDELNHAQVRWVSRDVATRLRPGDTVGVLGLAYKPQTPIAEESHGLALARQLARDGISVLAYDPAATEQARGLLADVADRVHFAAAIDECLQQCRVLVVATPWPQFKPAVAAWSRTNPGGVLVDCWRMFKPGELGEQIEYVPLGVGIAFPAGSLAEAANGAARFELANSGAALPAG
jgi:UDPglucose 6-dehydrogenase